MAFNQTCYTTARSCLFFSAYRLPVAAGTRHSRRSLFILPWFPKTRISISHEANGTRDFRHRSPAHLCNVVYRAPGIGFMVHSSFENRDRDWMARAEAAYAPMRLCTFALRHAKPLFCRSLSHPAQWRCLEKCEEKNAARNFMHICDDEPATRNF